MWWLRSFVSQYIIMNFRHLYYTCIAYAQNQTNHLKMSFLANEDISIIGTFTRSSLLPVLEVIQELFDFWKFCRVYQFTFIYDVFCQTGQVTVFIQTLHSYTVNAHLKKITLIHAHFYPHKKNMKMSVVLNITWWFFFSSNILFEAEVHGTKFLKTDNSIK